MNAAISTKFYKCKLRTLDEEDRRLLAGNLGWVRRDRGLGYGKEGRPRAATRADPLHGRAGPGRAGPGLSNPRPATGCETRFIRVEQQAT